MEDYDFDDEELEQEDDEEAPAWILWLMDHNLDLPFIFAGILLILGLMGVFFWVVTKVAK